MRKKFIFAIFLISFLECIYSYSYKPKTLPIYIYKEDDIYAPDAFFSPSNWIADYRSLHFDSKCTYRPKNGEYCIELEYHKYAEKIFGWAAVLWVFPVYNWGNIDGGLDLQEAKKITFWAKGKYGGETVLFKLGGIYGVFSETADVVYGPVELTRYWKLYEFSLEDEDLSHIVTGFSVFISEEENENNFRNEMLTVYFDDIAIR